MMNNSELFEKSKQLVPGGVHSPVRSFKGLHTTPRFVEKAKGAYIVDVEGKEYIDFCQSFGPLILGHAHPKIVSALLEQTQKGTSYGACEPYSLEMAEFLVDKLPHIDQIRFVNSGTEAVMTAVRLARGYSKRNKIIKFDGCYHGHLDSLLIKAGSGLAGTAEASSQGVPTSVGDETFIIELGDLAGVEEVLKRHPDEVALIAIEPLPANNGLLPQDISFLKGLRRLADQYGCLLLFDEVISGFRCGFQGMVGETGIIPDMVCYGKIIGGGLPVGAVAAKREVMEHLAPVGGVYQAGTLSANPLAMVAGLTGLRELTDLAYETLDGTALKIKEMFEKWFKEYDGGKFAYYTVVQHRSLFWFIPGRPISKVSDMPADLGASFRELFEVLLNKGIYLSPNAYEIGFVSLAHNQDVLDDLENRLWS